MLGAASFDSVRRPLVRRHRNLIPVYFVLSMPAKASMLTWVAEVVTAADSGVGLR